MSDNLKGIVPQIAISWEAKTVTIELICSDAYAARVLFDDVLAKVKSDKGIVLSLRGRLSPETGTSA